MPIPLDDLVAPVSPENPCGADLSYDPSFQELETLLLGKPETQFSAAEPPEWSQVQKRCLELLGRSKHLRIIATLTAALVRTNGLAGFRDGLALLEAVVRLYWDTVYPRLDPEDNNDPTERLNTIAALTTPVGVVGDPYKIVEGLRLAPLSASQQMGRLSLHEVQRSQTGAAEGGKPAVPASQVEAAFRDTPPETLAAMLASVQESQALLKGLIATLGEKVESDRVPNFDVLTGALREIQKVLASHSAGGAAEPAEESTGALAGISGGGSAAPHFAGGGAGAGFSGGVGSREDVLRALEAISRYYAQHEPSSPVPLLLDRAKRLVPMDFLAIMQDWAPEAVAQVNIIAGIR